MFDGVEKAKSPYLAGMGLLLEMGVDGSADREVLGVVGVDVGDERVAHLLHLCQTSVVGTAETLLPLLSTEGLVRSSNDVLRFEHPVLRLTASLRRMLL